MPDLYVPATAEKKLERDQLRDRGPEHELADGQKVKQDNARNWVSLGTSTDGNEPEPPPRAPRSMLRGARTGNGNAPAFFEGGPLDGKTFELPPGKTRVAMPVVINANERATCHLAGQPVPLPVVVHVRYRKRPGYAQNGALRFVPE